MKATIFATALSSLAVSGAAMAQIETAPPLPMDSPQAMRSMEAVCTGIGADSRKDPRWDAYSLKIEVVGTKGQYLGETRITVIKDDEAVVSVRCGGPWVLLRIEPGVYGVTAELDGIAKSAKVSVGGKNQARVVIRFPDR